MTTIPQRLREIAVRIGTLDMAAYVQLRAIANELEAPAADAVPVVAHLSTDKTKFMYDSTIQARGGLSVWHEYTRPLVYHSDHLATVSALQATIASQKAALIDLTVENERWARDFPALQARINELEARQKWTAVADGLPPKNTEVLICFEGQNTLVSTGQWTGSIHDVGGWCYPWENRGATDDGEDPVVTHWMDAPELPQPDTSKEQP